MRWKSSGKKLGAIGDGSLWRTIRHHLHANEPINTKDCVPLRQREPSPMALSLVYAHISEGSAAPAGAGILYCGLGVIRAYRAARSARGTQLRSRVFPGHFTPEQGFSRALHSVTGLSPRTLLRSSVGAAICRPLCAGSYLRRRSAFSDISHRALIRL